LTLARQDAGFSKFCERLRRADGAPAATWRRRSRSASFIAEPQGQWIQGRSIAAGYTYHGRVKALAVPRAEGGLQF